MTNVNLKVQIFYLQTMKISKTIMLLAIVWVFAQCSQEEMVVPAHKEAAEETQTPQEEGTSGTSYSRDWSSRVEIAISFKDFTGRDVQNTVSPPDGYVLIGGGAYVLGNKHPGAYVMASHPIRYTQNWFGRSREHSAPFNHTLRIYAVGLKLLGVSYEELKGRVKVFQGDNGALHNVSNDCVSHDGWRYRLIGGGVSINTIGHLLTKCIPEGQNWCVESKDHHFPTRGFITSYAIGITESIPGFGELEFSEPTRTTTSYSTGYKLATVFPPDNSWVMACPGGMVDPYPNQDSPYNLITGIIPKTNKGEVWVKDHIYQAGAKVTAYATFIRKKR